MESFEERLAHLEELSEKIRDREVDIEEAMKLFDEGMALSKGIEKELEGFERKVEILGNLPDEDGSGEPELMEFGEEE